MRLEKVLDVLNQIEKSSFLKTLDNISSNRRENSSEIDKIISEGEGQIKNIE